MRRVVLRLLFWSALLLVRARAGTVDYAGQLDSLGADLHRLEMAGTPNLCAQQIFEETRWLVSATRDFPRIERRLADLRAALAEPANLLARDEQSRVDGSWGKWYTEWFFKLDATYTQVARLDAQGRVPEYPVRLLDRINSPEKLTAHLTNLLTTDREKDGVKRRRELNETIAALVRFITRGQPKNYAYHPQLKQALLDFLMHNLRNPETGYWGARIKSRSQIRPTNDLSITFHIVSYLNGEISDWPKVIDTTLAIKDDDYPYGWLEGGYVNHHNMDVVDLFSRGWKHASSRQQEAMRTEIRKMLTWCLRESLQPDGSFHLTKEDASVESSTYYGAEFLARLGYFDRTRRFWTDEDFPEAPHVRANLAKFIREHLNSGGEGGNEYRDALAAIGAAP